MVWFRGSTMICGVSPRFAYKGATALRMAADDHNEPLSRARRLRSWGKRVLCRDSSMAGNWMLTVFASTSGRLEKEVEPFSGSILSSFKTRPDSGDCCNRFAKRKSDEKSVPRSRRLGSAADHAW